MKGRVTKSTGSWYLLLTEEEQFIKARIRGKFRLDNIQHTNPISVGDFVEYEVDSDGLGVIHHIYERKNYIIRKSVNLSKKSHIIASNIDQAFLIITLDNPRTSLGFIDRFLVTAEAYQIPVVLVINKMDVYKDEVLEELTYYKGIYSKIGYKVLEISAASGLNLNKLKSELKDKTSLIAGHSGVGKSTLMNVLNPELNLKTSLVSDFNQKGQHTTTFAEMYKWPFGGFSIDTPGIKEFGLVEMEKEEIQRYFPEIYELKSQCKFDNCMHTIEPKCAVRNAYEDAQIAPSRYENYLGFINELES